MTTEIIFDFISEISEWNNYGQPEGMSEIIWDKWEKQAGKETMTLWQKIFPVRAAEERLSLTEKKLTEEYEYYEKMRRLDIPFWFRQMSLDRIADYEKRIGRIKMNIYFLENPAGNELTGQEIAYAREYPIAEIIEINKSNFAVKNPFREEKQSSLYCRNNFWHDFGTGKTGDVIDLVMHIKNLDFPKAVKFLLAEKRISEVPQTLL